MLKIVFRLSRAPFYAYNTMEWSLLLLFVPDIIFIINYLAVGAIVLRRTIIVRLVCDR